MELDRAEDLEKFSALMMILGEVFTREVSPALVEIYAQVLRDWTIQELDVAIWGHVTHGSYFPKPVELIELAKDERVRLRALGGHVESICSGYPKRGQPPRACFLHGHSHFAAEGTK